jgi:alkaline phosphatase
MNDTNNGMNRRSFLNLGLLAAAGSTLSASAVRASTQTVAATPSGKTAKNIIFLVSDGMSNGTLNMADLLLQRKAGHPSRWIQLYRERKAIRAMVDTASADALVTDSAAGSSAWGGGVRVNNGSLNVTPDGAKPKPILQKFKAAGKSVGCVTTVTITHATPAGFCINVSSRGKEDDIAAAYFTQKFDVLMGGGSDFFLPGVRKDKRDLAGEFIKAGYEVVQNKASMLAAKPNKPMLGIFCKGAMPYAVDHASDRGLIDAKPTLVEMARKAIEILSANPNGFVLQIEGGKVDWGAHANDIGALVYDQIAFDEAVAEAVRFAESNGETLVIVTSDHGNSSPGLIKCKNVNACFDTLQHFKHTNEWVLQGIRPQDTPQQVIDRIKDAQGIVFKKEEAAEILKSYSSIKGEAGLYNAYKLPFKRYAELQKTYTSVGWSGMDHTGEFVELAALGPGSENIPLFIKNIDLHNIMLAAAGRLG